MPSALVPKFMRREAGTLREVPAFAVCRMCWVDRERERSMADYLVVTSPENWQKTSDLGWSVLGLKSTRHNVAQSLHSGDRIVCYATGLKRFIGVIEVTGSCYEDHSPIWGGKKAGEDYPFRYPIKPIVVVGNDRGLDATALAPELEFPRKWGAHLSLAFQGNIKPIPAADVDTLQDALNQVAATTPAPV
jgi:predicted RNA-binding protein